MQKALAPLFQELNQILLGKERQIELAVCCLLARGHLLIEDIPGMGKTTLSHALSSAIGLSYNRVQFTSDLLPADLLGVNIFNRETQRFNFHQGPVFSQVLLADEINRAPPKSQSALLEAMEEGQVSIEGETRTLPKPFFVIATQNPQEQAGTFPLPESQLDRFLMRISLGYPPPDAEKQLLKGVDRRQILDSIKPCLSVGQLSKIQEDILNISTSDPVIDYIHRIIQFSREQEGFGYGLSPRGGLALLRAAKAWCYIQGRQAVTPDDVQAVLPNVVEHRVSKNVAINNYPFSTKILTGVDIF